MRNLLPKNYRRRVKNEYLLRVVVIALALILTASVIGAALLIPSYFLSRSKKNAILEQAELIERSIARSEGEVSFEMLRKTRDRLTFLSRDRERTTIIALIKTIIEEEPSGIVLSDISYSREGEGATIAVSGSAKRRDDLISFRSALNRNDQFLSVTLPVSDLARSSDIRFTITFKVKI